MLEKDIEEGYIYDEKAMAAAWRLFVNSGVVDETVVRPLVARSWIRCRAAGINPWSSEFPAINDRLLNEKRALYSHSVEANEPVMQVLMALLNCNVSLMDQENFVFMFVTPLSHYPRTVGTYQLENILGTGNATVVAYEKRPVRIEGFEGYRSVSQGYSGVSVPYLDVDGEYFGAMNLNSPFGPLPPQALDMCIEGVALCNKLFLEGRRLWTALRTAEFFQSLADLMPEPVVFLDSQGHILIANEAMKPYVPGFEDFAYGEQSITAYLDRQTSLKTLMNDDLDEEGLEVLFRAPRKRSVKKLQCVNRREVKFKNGLRFSVLKFANPSDNEGEADRAKSEEYAKRTMLKRFADVGEVDYIGETPEWKKVDDIVDRIAAINANALILGETGTGKELVARAIHRRSGRTGQFVAINCGAIPRDLFAAELFGYEAGAFTGAKEGGAIGKIEAANHGTVLLDEIGEMPLDLQVGLLRVIQDQAVIRLGSTEVRPLDVRFLAATNQDLGRMIEAREFRADLYYRLSSIEIQLPPLRNRVDDVPLLIEHFNKRLSGSLCLDYSPFSEEIDEAMKLYAWPGNVRELRNAVERCLILAGTGSQVTMAHLPMHIANAHSIAKNFVPAPIEQMQKLSDEVVQEDTAAPVRSSAKASKYELTEAEKEDREKISKLLLDYGGNLSKVASVLGISRTTLYKRLDYYHLHIRLVVEVDE